MTDRQSIEQYVSDTLCQLFELEKDDITLEANLYDDLDIDSIDAVDLIVELKNFTGKKIKPEEFKSVRTVGDIVDAVEKLMS